MWHLVFVFKEQFVSALCFPYCNLFFLPCCYVCVLKKKKKVISLGYSPKEKSKREEKKTNANIGGFPVVISDRHGGTFLSKSQPHKREISLKFPSEVFRSRHKNHEERIPLGKEVVRSCRTCSPRQKAVANVTKHFSVSFAPLRCMANHIFLP